MSALRPIRCQCDIVEVAGLLPGRTCPRCGFLREPLAPDDAQRLNEQAIALRAAARLLDAISGNEDSPAASVISTLGAVQISLGRVTRVLGEARESLLIHQPRQTEASAPDLLDRMVDPSAAPTEITTPLRAAERTNP